jgi:hypothetical protein
VDERRKRVALRGFEGLVAASLVAPLQGGQSAPTPIPEIAEEFGLTISYVEQIARTPYKRFDVSDPASDESHRRLAVEALDRHFITGGLDRDGPGDGDSVREPRRTVQPSQLSGVTESADDSA